MRVVSLFSCRATYPEYGISILKLKNDSLSTIAAKKKLNNLPAQDFLSGSFLSNAHQTIPYRLLTPGRQQSSKKYPLIITLHNSGRIGTDNIAQLEPLARIWLNKRDRRTHNDIIFPALLGESIPRWLFNK